MTAEVQTKGGRTRLLIEDAAVELFMEHGYHATSMRQIAERAELALGGIYNHFKSKEEIFEAIIVDKHPYKKLLPVIVDAEGEAMDEFLSNAARVVIKELTSQPYYVKLMLIEIVEFNGIHGSALIREIAPKIMPVFEKLVKTRKNLRAISPALLMRSFIGMVLSYIITDMIVANSVLNKFMPKNVLDAYVDIYMYGIIKETQ